MLEGQGVSESLLLGCWGSLDSHSWGSEEVLRRSLRSDLRGVSVRSIELEISVRRLASCDL